MSLNNTMSMKPTRVEATIAGKKLTLETGQVARQAGGAVIATLGDTRCFAAATAGNARDDIDFFPLVCDYREKTEAAGKIPGGFFKREGRPTTKEILTMRLIDRSIRPMIAEGFKAEVQVMTSVMQYDGENNPDVVAMIAAFTAIRIAGMPFETTLGAVRIAHIDGKLVAAAKREPGHVIGNGEQTIEQLVEIVNRDPRRGVGHEKVLTRLEFDHQAERLLKKIGYDKIAFGTDIITDPEMMKRANEEFRHRTEWFTPAEVMKQATYNSAQLLAMSGPRNPYPGKLGVIEEGALADILLIDGNPLEDIEVVVNPTDNLKLIMKDGEIFKNTL